MSLPHKWNKEIKAWADGAQIEFRFQCEEGWKPWMVIDPPIFNTDPDYEYRIKPQPVTTVQYLQKRSFMGKTCYIAFDPDLEHWDLKITYVDGVANKVELPK